MTAGKIGLQKLNMQKTLPPKDAIANNLRGASVSRGVSYGIFAQRSLTGSGVHLNNKIFNSASISETRHALNDNRLILNNNIGVPRKCHHNDGDTTMNKFMMGMYAMNMIAKMGAQTVDVVNSAKTNKAENTNLNNNNKNTISEGWQGQFDTDKFTMSKNLKAAKSFADINKVEQEANGALEKFQENYSKTGTTNISGINDLIATGDVKSGLDLANVNIDTSKLELSNLKINVDDLSTLDGALKTIDDDIAKANKFISEDLTKGIETLTSKGGEIQKQIGTLDAKKQAAEQAEANGEKPTPSSSEIQHQIDELKKQKQQIDTAKKALQSGGDVRKGVDDLIKDLKTKQDEIGDIKQVKADMADKKYQVAEQLQKDINNTQKKLGELDGKIDKAKTDEDKKKLIEEFNGLIDKLDGYKQDVSAAGKEPIKNAKGNKAVDFSKIEIKTFQKKAQVSTSASSGGEAIRGLELGANRQIMPKLALATDVDSCIINQKVEVNGQQYTKISNDTFQGPDGTISAEELKGMEQSTKTPDNNMFGPIAQGANWFTQET